MMKKSLGGSPLLMFRKTKCLRNEQLLLEFPER